MKYCIIDLETTIKESFKRKANPFDPANRIVMVGRKIQGQDIHLSNVDVLSAIDRELCYVGHNIKFDLLHIYIYKKDNWRPSQIWDTQLAEYILSGNTTHMCGLRDIAENKYECPYRDKKMEIFWDQGICTSQIPEEIVREDLTYDLLDTEQVFLGQVKKAKELGLINFIKTQMNALLATTEMEYSGIHVDYLELIKLKDEMEIKLQEINEEFYNDYVNPNWKMPFEFNLNSNDHLSALLFGGTFTINQKEEIGLYKNGNVKYGKIPHTYTQTGLVEDQEKDMTSKFGVFKVDESHLSNLDHPCVKHILHYKKMAKDYNTYYSGLLELVNPIDNCIHHQLNHVTTITGRLSSRNPNMQNIPRSDKSEFKKVFTSRFDGGSIIEFDYSMLEVRIAAVIFNDPILLQELRDGIDLYKKNSTWFYGINEDRVTKEQRQVVKGFILGILYGKGAYSLAKESEIDQEICQEFIDKFYDKYKAVALGHKIIIEQSERNKASSNYFTKSGNRANIYKHKTVLGNILTFVENDAPDFIVRKTGKLTSFNPPDLKNHPIQSVASVLVMVMVAELNRWLTQNGFNDRIKLINTIHDSIMLDVDTGIRMDNEMSKGNYITQCELEVIKELLEDIPTLVKGKFNLDWDCEFPVEMKIGDNWYDCK